MAEATLTAEGLTHEIRSAYVTDPDWRAYRASILVDTDGIKVEGIRGDRFVLFVFLDIEGFGRTCVPVDGDGAGLCPGRYGLSIELLRSRAVRCKNLAESLSVSEWDTISDQVEYAINSGDAASCSRLLGAAIVAAEELLYRKKLSESHETARAPVFSTTLFGERQGDYSIGVGPDWNPKTAPDFTRAPRSAMLALALVSGTTLPNFWRYVEFEKGKLRWERIDRILEMTTSAGLRLKSFALYWGGIGGCPPWFRTLSYPAQLAAVEEWVTAIVDRYRGRISCWETVNEMHNWSFGNPFAWTHEQSLEVTRLVNELVGVLDPGTPRLINNCCIWGDYVQGGAGRTWQESEWQPDWTPLQYMEAVCERSIPFEAIGLQYYNPGRDIYTCFETLEQFAAFDKEIQITEMGTPSSPARSAGVETGQTDPMSGWRGMWTPERQALWLDRFFTIFGATPCVTVLNYWDFDDAQAFIANAGLVDREFQPKPGYSALAALARRWNPQEYEET